MSDLEPGMMPPDWERYKVAPAGHVMHVGDPTRWGAQAVTPLNDALLAAAPFGIGVSSGQLLQVQTRDGYSRSWSMLGTLSLPGLQWNAVGASMSVELELVMGVGQAQITHRIVLFSAFTTPYSGLCMTQHRSQGGPYDGTSDSASGTEARAFAIIGGLVGQSISAQCLYGGSTPVAGLPATSRIALIVTPYAAGEGL
jgi:hypothetical protein